MAQRLVDPDSNRQLLYRLPEGGRAEAVGKGGSCVSTPSSAGSGRERRVRASPEVHGRVGVMRVMLTPPMNLRGAQC